MHTVSGKHWMREGIAAKDVLGRRRSGRVQCHEEVAVFLGWEGLDIVHPVCSVRIQVRASVKVKFTMGSRRRRGTYMICFEDAAVNGNGAGRQAEVTYTATRGSSFFSAPHLSNAVRLI